VRALTARRMFLINLFSSNLEMMRLQGFFRGLMVLAMVLLGGAASAQAQRAPERVRVLAPSFVDSAFVATLTGRDAQEIVVVPAASQNVLRIPREAVQRLEVSRGRSSYRVPGLVIGALVGAAAAGLAAHDSDCTFVCEPVVFYSALGGLVAGGGAGYLIGGQFHHGPERWRQRDE